MVVWCVNYVILQHYILHLYQIFFVNMERIYYLCNTKRKQQPKHKSPLIYNVMIIKHLQGGGLPTSASSVNAMCGACRPSCNPFRNDHLPFFLRHRQARRRNQGLQQSRRQSATLASCKAIIKGNAIETSRSCVLTVIMWRSAL